MIFQRLCLLEAILAHQTSNGMFSGSWLIFWHPRDLWGRIHIDLNKNSVWTSWRKGLYDAWYLTSIYLVNLKCKDRNLINAMFYTYLRLAICIGICISDDGWILWRAQFMFYSSPQLLDWPKQRQIFRKRAFWLTPNDLYNLNVISKRFQIAWFGYKNNIAFMYISKRLLVNLSPIKWPLW